MKGTLKALDSAAIAFKSNTSNLDSLNFSATFVFSLAAFVNLLHPTGLQKW
jgi:hypothetical protein